MNDEQQALTFKHRKAWTRIWVNYLDLITATRKHGDSHSLICLHLWLCSHSDVAARAVYEIAPTGTKIKPELKLWPN